MRPVARCVSLLLESYFPVFKAHKYVGEGAKQHGDRRRISLTWIFRHFIDLVQISRNDGDLIEKCMHERRTVNRKW